MNVIMCLLKKCLTDVNNQFHEYMIESESNETIANEQLLKLNFSLKQSTQMREALNLDREDLVAKLEATHFEKKILIENLKQQQQRYTNLLVIHLKLLELALNNS